MLLGQLFCEELEQVAAVGQQHSPVLDVQYLTLLTQQL
jgi:hypothetical protein